MPNPMPDQPPVATYCRLKCRQRLQLSPSNFLQALVIVSQEGGSSGRGGDKVADDRDAPEPPQAVLSPEHQARIAGLRGGTNSTSLAMLLKSCSHPQESFNGQWHWSPNRPHLHNVQYRNKQYKSPRHLQQRFILENSDNRRISGCVVFFIFSPYPEASALSSSWKFLMPVFYPLHL